MPFAPANPRSFCYSLTFYFLAFNSSSPWRVLCAVSTIRNRIQVLNRLLVQRPGRSTATHSPSRSPDFALAVLSTDHTALPSPLSVESHTSHSTNERALLSLSPQLEGFIRLENTPLDLAIKLAWPGATSRAGPQRMSVHRIRDLGHAEGSARAARGSAFDQPTEANSRTSNIPARRPDLVISASPPRTLHFAPCCQ